MGKPKLAVIFLSAAIVAYGLVGGLLEKVSARDDAYGQLSIFTDVLRKIQSDYVETPQMKETVKGSLLGMMESLDAYSSFVDAETYRTLAAQSRMTASPGIVLSKRYGYAYVVAAAEGGAAASEGLRSGDLLESIEGRPTTRMSLWEAESLLKGPEGSTVKVRVVRARRSQPTEFELERRAPRPARAASNIDADGVGRLTIPEFGPGTAADVSARLKVLKASNLKGLLLDVRGAALGTLEEAVAAADLFLPRGKKIVSVRDRAGAAVESVSLSDPLLSGVPLALLVDGGTSGAAEVFAAALQDGGVASVVGEKSNGFGSVQQEFDLGDGSVLFISTKLYFRPNGEPLQAAAQRDSGIKPDVRSPSQEFVTNFYFENASEDAEDSLIDEFYRKLDQAIEKEQLDGGLRFIREKVFQKAA